MAHTPGAPELPENQGQVTLAITPVLNLRACKESAMRVAAGFLAEPFPPATPPKSPRRRLGETSRADDGMV